MRISDWSSDVCSSDLNRHIVPASAIAHAQIRDDRDFLAVLRPDGEGGYTLMTANLWAYRPKISGTDRKSDVSGKSVSVRVDLGGRRLIKKQKTNYIAHSTKQIIQNSIQKIYNH